MGGKSQKKRRLARKASYERTARQAALRHARATAKAYAWFNIPEMLQDELLPHCDLLSLLSISKMNRYARDIVQDFTAANLRYLVGQFIHKDDIPKFFDLLHNTCSGVAGSVVTAILTAPYRHEPGLYQPHTKGTGVRRPPIWILKNLNVLMPQGTMPAWRSFFDDRGLNLAPNQLGVDRKYRHTTADHVVYQCRTSLRAAGLTIQLSESRDDSVLTPLVGATTTFSTNLLTSANIYALYGDLLAQRRALEGWFPTEVPKATVINRRRYKSSFSTGSWGAPCGLSCPVLWRQVRDLSGVGIFHYGGVHKTKIPDNSKEGIPYTDTDLKWRLGDTCANKHCPWYRANYFSSFYRNS
ncbi:hypothetical protein DFH06DRAFT_1333929 [Mycena polygramma]|nr:hypothetical protein DFH06DRAFT_1333929 [Mycena polygramma]